MVTENPNTLLESSGETLLLRGKNFLAKCPAGDGHDQKT